MLAGQTQKALIMDYLRNNQGEWIPAVVLSKVANTSNRSVSQFLMNEPEVQKYHTTSYRTTTLYKMERSA